MIRRNTNQKQIVYETINAKGHITSEELILEIMGNHNDISLASIYRNLNILSMDKKIKKIKLSNIDVYETVKEKHYHYQCKECNSIFDIPVEDIPDEIINLNRISNENVTDCDIVFYGVCHNCLKNRKGDKENEEVRM